MQRYEYFWNSQEALEENDYLCLNNTAATYMSRRKSPPILSENELKQVLAGRGMKATAQRLAVHRAMCALEHAAPDDVASYIKSELGASISTASIYNILSQFADCGIYSRRMGQNGMMQFDAVRDNHLHLYDRTTGEHVNVSDDGMLSQIEASLKGRRFRGYKVEYVDVQIVCRPTRRKTGKA